MPGFGVMRLTQAQNKGPLIQPRHQGRQSCPLNVGYLYAYFR